MRNRTRLFTILLLLTSLALFGCDDGGGENGEDTGMDAGDMMTGDTGVDTSTPDTDEDTSTPDTTADGTDTAGDAGDTTPPEIQNITVVENPNMVVAAYVEFDTNEDATASVEVVGPEETWTVDGPAEANTTFSIPVIGMHAETEYSFNITAVDSAGNNATDGSTTYTTPALPANFPPISVAATNGTGQLLFDVREFGGAAYVIAVDEAGEVIWYSERAAGIQPLRQTDDGTILFVEDEQEIYELDLEGNMLNMWDITDDFGLDSVHHEISPLPNGNYVILSSELHQDVPGFTDMNGNDVTYNIVSDVVAEIDLETNTVVAEFDLFDSLSDYRTRERPGFHGSFWDDEYANDVDSTKDWTHGNAVILDERDDSYILSLRHQDWIVKISRSDGSLIWRLGEEGDFTLNSGEWQYHQHAPLITPDGTLLLYDNGNGRPGVADADLYSRAVEFDLDETNMTADQVWEHRTDPDTYAPFVSDADLNAAGNVVITHGGIVSDPTLGIGDPANKVYSRIIEVTKDTGDIVFDLTVRDESATDFAKYRTYRSNPVTIR